MTCGLSYHDGHTLADSCARSARRRKFSRWHSKIAAPPFPEGSFRALSYSFIINNVIPRCIPPPVHTRRALFRRSPIVESSHRGVRVGHTWLRRVYTRSPPPHTTLRIDSPRVCFNPSVTIPATSATFARARRDARQGSPRDLSRGDGTTTLHHERPRRLRRRSTHRRLGALNK